MDQCKHCQLRGDMVKCIQEDCTIHESWYVLEILEHIKELTEQLKSAPSNSDYEKCEHERGSMVTENGQEWFVCKHCNKKYERYF